MIVAKEMIAEPPAGTRLGCLMPVGGGNDVGRAILEIVRQRFRKDVASNSPLCTADQTGHISKSHAQCCDLNDIPYWMCL